jgi:hypothetical protein
MRFWTQRSTSLLETSLEFTELLESSAPTPHPLTTAATSGYGIPLFRKTTVFWSQVIRMACVRIIKKIELVILD